MGEGFAGSLQQARSPRCVGGMYHCLPFCVVVVYSRRELLLVPWNIVFLIWKSVHLSVAKILQNFVRTVAIIVYLYQSCVFVCVLSALILLLTAQKVIPPSYLIITISTAGFYFYKGGVPRDFPWDFFTSLDICIYQHQGFMEYIHVNSYEVSNISNHGKVLIFHNHSYDICTSVLSRIIFIERGRGAGQRYIPTLHWLGNAVIVEISHEMMKGSLSWQLHLVQCKNLSCQCFD